MPSIRPAQSATMTSSSPTRPWRRCLHLSVSANATSSFSYRSSTSSIVAGLAVSAGSWRPFSPAPITRHPPPSPGHLPPWLPPPWLPPTLPMRELPPSQASLTLLPPSFPAPADPSPSSLLPPPPLELPPRFLPLVVPSPPWPPWPPWPPCLSSTSPPPPTQRLPLDLRDHGQDQTLLVQDEISKRHYLTLYVQSKTFTWVTNIFYQLNW